MITDFSSTHNMLTSIILVCLSISSLNILESLITQISTNFFCSLWFSTWWGILKYYFLTLKSEHSSLKGTCCIKCYFSATRLPLSFIKAVRFWLLAHYWRKTESPIPSNTKCQHCTLEVLIKIEKDIQTEREWHKPIILPKSLQKYL